MKPKVGESFYYDVREDLKGILEYHRTEFNLKQALRALFASDAFAVMLMYRLRMLARKYHIPLVNRILRGLQTALYGIEIGSEVTLGHGVYFVHSLGTVVGQASTVGDRAIFYGSNTVGGGRDSGSPKIGAGAVIGAGARILGSVTIGDGASIGANAVVLGDVPSGAVAVGVPAKVLSKE